MTENISTGLYFIGEAIADLRASAGRNRSLDINLGGSSYFGSIGAAEALGRANLHNAKSFYVGPVPQDVFGSLFLEDFEKYGVGTAYTRRIEHISMLAVISTTGGWNKFDFYGRNKPNTIDNLKIEDIAYDLAEESQLFSVGSVVMTVPHARDAVTEYIKRKAADGHIVYFDPNTRPSIIDNREEYAKRLIAVSKHSSIVRFSEEDVAWTFPHEDHSSVAAKFLTDTMRAFIITHGAGGCTVYTKQGEEFVPVAHHDGIKFTVGAGDNFNAGILVALARRGITRAVKAAKLDFTEWATIAAEANGVAYQYLLRANKLAA